MSTQLSDLPAKPSPEVVEDLLARACEKLQLTEAQHRQATERYRAIAEWLDAPGSLLARFGPVIYPQGSLRIGTTVHLKGSDEFDLDAVCELKIDWSRTSPLAVLDAVQRRLSENETYSGMIERKNRCIRLVYANEFHIDILPAVPDADAGGTCVRIPDRRLEKWLPSNPIGYAEWFESRAARIIAVERLAMPVPPREPVETKPVLKMAVQLLKRWRDVRYESDPDGAPISIVLTMLAGQHYAGETAKLDTVAGIVTRVVASLPVSGRLKVCNPANLEEDLAERWDRDPSAYTAFSEGIRSLAGSLGRLRVARGMPAIRTILAELLGEKLVDTVINEQAREVEQQRKDGRLWVATGSGSLTTITGSGAVPIRPNTFYGD